MCSIFSAHFEILQTRERVWCTLWIKLHYWICFWLSNFRWLIFMQTFYLRVYNWLSNDSFQYVILYHLSATKSLIWLAFHECSIKYFSVCLNKLSLNEVNNNIFVQVYVYTTIKICCAREYGWVCCSISVYKLMQDSGTTDKIRGKDFMELFCPYWLEMLYLWYVFHCKT